MHSFKHSGDIGDIIYSLPTIRAMGGGKLYLSQAPFTRVMMSEKTLNLLKPLLEIQDYISGVELWDGEQVFLDLDKFRPYWDRNRNSNFAMAIADWQLLAFKQDVKERDRAWISCEANHVAKVIIARSSRYHTVTEYQEPKECFPWKKILAKYRKDAVFVGLPDEHGEFVTQFGPINHYKTDNYLQLAEVICGAKLFIGNQSSPFALAEGMKKDAILEIFMRDPNCILARPNCQYVFTPNVYLPDL